MAPVRWGLLSTASIGELVLRACRRSALTRFVAVASRDPATASRFAAEHGVELSREGRTEHLAVDPDGAYGLRHDDTDVYRIELDAVSAAIAGRGPLPFGRADAVAQARALEALLASAATGAPVSVPA